jgi:hypothetical protein
MNSVRRAAVGSRQPILFDELDDFRYKLGRDDHHGLIFAVVGPTF